MIFRDIYSEEKFIQCRLNALYIHVLLNAAIILIVMIPRKSRLYLCV